MNANNPIGLNGIEFVEWSGPDPERLAQILRDFGFSKVMRHATRAVDYWRQHDIHILVNVEPGSFAASFQVEHGPCISAMGWRVTDAEKALTEAVLRGAVVAPTRDYGPPAIRGIGDSLLYFIDDRSPAADRYSRLGFVPHPNAEFRRDAGFLGIDHLTNNVPRGTMQATADFYKRVFGFTEVRYFDIRGKKTGLTSYALRSPCGQFCIPINEGSEDKSQIDEYLREYKGPGVQHLAFLTDDILTSLDAMDGGTIETLDIDDEYYREVFDRVPNVTEDHEAIRHRNVLVDGDAEGYLLQIFTKNLIGPIFIELIQRKNHLSFGEGNFGALFRSIERDQELRGAL